MNLDRKAWIGLAALLLIGLCFLWPTYAIRMWNAGHYQFFVFVIAAVGWLLWTRKAEIEQSRSTPNSSVAFVIWMLIAGLITFANLAYSGFAAIIASILVTIATIYSVYGWGGLAVASRVLWLLVFVVPLPMLLDQALIVKMQVLASELASRLLDGTGVIHFRQGVIIETPQARFMTEEACSGIRSLFSSMAAVAMYGVSQRHRAWRIVINQFQAIVWVLIGNSIRVATVVAVAADYPGIATGWGHELLGIAVFGFILTMVASTDVALSRWIGDQLVIDTTCEPADGSSQVTGTLPPFPVAGISRKILFGVMVVMSLIALRTAWVRHTATSQTTLQTFAVLDDPLESDFKGDFAGFTKQSFTHMKRGGNAMWAENSFVYTFKRDSLQVIVSIDRPWNHWHNLHYCYSGLGWESTPTYAIASNALEDSDAGGPATASHKHSELMLKRRGRYGYVIFSAIDQAGDHVPETAVFDRGGIVAAARLGPEQILAALGLGGDKDQQVRSAKLPVSTIQVYGESQGVWNDDDLNSIRKLFFILREEIVRMVRSKR